MLSPLRPYRTRRTSREVHPPASGVPATSQLTSRVRPNWRRRADAGGGGLTGRNVTWVHYVYIKTDDYWSSTNSLLDLLGDPLDSMLIKVPGGNEIKAGSDIIFKVHWPLLVSR